MRTIIIVILSIIAWCGFITWLVRRVKQVTHTEALMAHWKHASTDKDMEILEKEAK